MSLIGISGKTYEMGSLEIVLDGIEGVPAPTQRHGVFEAVSFVGMYAGSCRDDAKSVARFMTRLSYPHRRYRVSKRRCERARREWDEGVRREAGRHDRFTAYTRTDAIVDEIRRLGGVVKLAHEASDP